jgi:hypothetical protein
LPAFLRHYRGLGVEQFFIIDNESSDGTAEYLRSQPDVRVFLSKGRFSESRGGTDWLNPLLLEFGNGFWCLTVDIDELLVYAGSEDASLATLTEYLDRHGYEALSCLLLDLYPAGSLKDCSYESGDDFLAAAPYFDAGPYRKAAVDRCPPTLITGGMRERVFYPEYATLGLVARIGRALLQRMLRIQQAVPPCLTKVPLVRWDEKTRYISCNHFVSPKRLARETGALLHFKFLQDFHVRAMKEAERGEYFAGAAEYRRYARTLRGTPDLTLMCEDSTKFESSQQLVELGLMQDTQAWRDARKAIPLIE